MNKIFNDKNEIEDFINKAKDINVTRELISELEKLKKERPEFYLTINELDNILKWKLRSQYERQKDKRDNINTDENVRIITKIAFAIKAENKDIEIVLKLRVLSTLMGVGIPVASAILTLCYPEEYAVIDFRNWRQVYPTKEKKGSSYSEKDYLNYLKEIKLLAQQYELTPQKIDIAIWSKDMIDYPDKKSSKS